MLQFGYALSLALSPFQHGTMEMKPDAYGRIANPNKMGYSEVNINSVKFQFLQWGKKHARRADQIPNLTTKMQTLVEFGGGLGFLAKNALESGIVYSFNDLSAEHVDIAEESFPPECTYSTFICRFPSKDSVKMTNWLKANRKVVGIGAFSVLHFLSAKEVIEFLAASYDLLEPGGRAFFSFGSPHNLALGFFPQIHERRKARFFNDPAHHRFPGEISNSGAFLNPRRYHQDTKERDPKSEPQYPDFLNVMDPDTFRYLVGQLPENRRFEVIEADYIQRPEPPSQGVMLRYPYGVGEMVGVILQKPGELKPLPSIMPPANSSATSTTPKVDSRWQE